jgi:hypothetical protein
VDPEDAPKRGDTYYRAHEIRGLWGTELVAVPKEVPQPLRDLVARIAIETEDKWGPAGALEVTGAEAKALRDRLGLKGKRGVRFYVFFGWASS